MTCRVWLSTSSETISGQSQLETRQVKSMKLNQVYCLVIKNNLLSYHFSVSNITWMYRYKCTSYLIFFSTATDMPLPDEDCMCQAVDAVQGGSSISSAARQHGVARTTLSDRVRGTHAARETPGPKPILLNWGRKWLHKRIH